MAFESSVSQVVVGGDTVIRLQWRDTQGGGIPTFAARNFGIEDATLCEFTSDWEVNDVAGRSRAEWGIYRSETGDGIVVAIEHAGAVWSMGIGTTGSWAQQGSFIDGTTVAGLAVNTFWRMHIKAEVKEDDSTTVTATVRDLSDNELGTLTATVNVPRGGYCGFHSCFDQLGSASTFDVKNIRVQASGATGFVPKLTSTAYVYTFVNNRGWESVPSLPTANVLRPDGVQVTVTTSTTAPVGYPAVTLKRIYRVVQALTGDLFLLVAEIPLAQADFVDNLADNEVGPDELLSQNFDLPPDGLRGIMALPSGAYCGFVGKQLCISAAGWPHAWPLQQRHSCEFNIVAIGKVGNTIVVGTEGRAYTCTGTDPGSYVMSEPGESQACVAKRGMVFLDGQGVAFPSPDGYQLCAGSAGNLRNLTETIFTRQQWRAKNPASIIAAVHDGVLHWYWKTAEAAAETVLFLFHMLDSTSSEGFLEFTEFYGAHDQTGAAWTPSNSHWALGNTSPAPQFGAFRLSGTGGNETVSFERELSAPSVALTASSSFAVDAWVLKKSDISTSQIFIEIGHFDYSTGFYSFTLKVGDDDVIKGQYDGSSAFISIDGPAIALNTWTHVRVNYDGAVMRLFVNGSLAGSDSAGGISEDIGTINFARIILADSFNGSVYVDEAYSVVGTPISTSNFTPPTAPWPNP